MIIAQLTFGARLWTSYLSTANLPTNIVDFGGVLLKHNLNSKGWNSHVHRGFPGKFESSNVSRDNVSREIGRSTASFVSRAFRRVKDHYTCLSRLKRACVRQVVLDKWC